MDLEQNDVNRALAELEGLYERNPERFEECSRRLIAAFIDTAPEALRARLWGMQRRIDAELCHYHDPVARMNRMVELFWDQVHRFLGALKDPDGVHRETRPKGPPARVLPFRRSSRLH